MTGCITHRSDLVGVLDPTAGSDAAGDHGTMRVLMTVDAVGGVWRYAMELARAMKPLGVDTVFAGLGPRPAPAQGAEAEAIGEVAWLDAPLDWMVADEHELGVVRDCLTRAAETYDVDLLHLNAPSQACGLEIDIPLLVVSHSCVVTWWEAMRGGALPDEWQWQRERNKAGFQRADVVVSPSRSHADLIERCYGALPNLNVVHNAVEAPPPGKNKEEFVFAAGRWWDDGKNGRILDLTSRRSVWPIYMAGSVSGPGGQKMAIEHARALGQISNETVLSYMQRAGIVASPSLYEPFGLVALEAAHAGCALILSDIPTYRELWSEAALFFDPQNAVSLAEAIDRLACDTALRMEMARCAATRAKLLSPQTQGVLMMTLYGAIAGVEDVRSAPEA
ncbi:glycosyltransferase family 4 protein [Nitratireductor luteus]|uniref:glycosyltransferase family 4 protein n=1 Tax=Nitratireductor luteus TaxID=2976980 RepID=UPI00223E9DA3|nr:glycosyltransferase family 4 protein [Nitratireductor luteus]